MRSTSISSPDRTSMVFPRSAAVTVYTAGGGRLVTVVVGGGSVVRGGGGSVVAGIVTTGWGAGGSVIGSVTWGGGGGVWRGPSSCRAPPPRRVEVVAVVIPGCVPLVIAGQALAHDGLWSVDTVVPPPRESWRPGEEVVVALAT